MSLKDDYICPHTGEVCDWRQAAVDLEYRMRASYSADAANKSETLSALLARNCVGECIIEDAVATPEFFDIRDLLIRKKERLERGFFKWPLKRHQ